MENQYIIDQIQIRAKELEQFVAKQQTGIDPLFIEVLKKKCVDLYELVLTLNHAKMIEHTVSKETRVWNLPESMIDEVPLEPIQEPFFQEPLIENSEPLVDTIVPIIEAQIHSDSVVNETYQSEEQKLEEISLTESHAQDSEIINDFIDGKIAQDKPVEQIPIPLVELHEISLHEKLSSSAESKIGLADKLQQKVESLKSAISLNQKIAFVNVLFKENTVEYAKAIEKLNNANNVDEAMRYFTELKLHYDWENDNELVKSLQGLIEKRFA